MIFTICDNSSTRAGSGSNFPALMGQAFAILHFNAAKIAAFALIAPRGAS